jgi:hypothetical protein
MEKRKSSRVHWHPVDLLAGHLPQKAFLTSGNGIVMISNSFVNEFKKLQSAPDSALCDRWEIEIREPVAPHLEAVGHENT